MKKLSLVVSSLVLSCFVVVTFLPSSASADKYACADSSQKNKPQMVSSPKECVPPKVPIVIQEGKLAQKKAIMLQKAKPEDKQYKSLQRRQDEQRAEQICETFCDIYGGTGCCIVYCCDVTLANCIITEFWCRPAPKPGAGSPQK